MTPRVNHLLRCALGSVAITLTLLATAHAQAAVEQQRSAESIDRQTQSFVERIRADEHNRALGAAFAERLAMFEQGGQAIPTSLQGVRVLFVPGYAWKSDRTTGADFARQRDLLSRMNVEHQLIETDERGSIEDKAQRVLQAVLAQPQGAQLLIVSASKGGPEVALALSELARQPAAIQQTVRAWVSVGGMLRGTPLADFACQWPVSWFAHLMLWAKGLNGQILHDMRPERRKAALAQLSLPAHILLLQYVGAPAASQVSDGARGNFERLAAHGPNDGLTLLTDQLLPGSLVVVDEGLDHYFRDPRIDIKTLVLAQLVAERMAQASR
jgi:hypothetical protein